MSQISFRIDDDLKRSAEQVLNDIGIPMSAAITVFLKKVSRERRIPFELTADPFYSESNIKHLEDIAVKIENGTAKLVEHDLIEAE